ncbi:MAG: NTPase [Candidatus Pacearchaeota archaeon]
MKIFVSGQPGCGKSTFINELIRELRKKKKVAGFITPEIRERKDKERSGFLIKDVTTGKEVILASKKLKEGPKFGNYRINLAGINEIIDELEKQISGAEVIIIDEIGKMEMFSEKFKKIIAKLLTSKKPLIASLHRSYAGKYKSLGKVFWLTKENKEEVKREILKSLEA